MKTFILVAVAALGGLLVVMMFVNNKPANEVPTETSVVTDDVALTAEPTTEIPDNVPMYPGAVLDKTTEANTDTERNVTLTLVTPDSVPDVVKWYRGALSADGWAVTDDKNVGGYILLKGENENVTVFMQSASGENNDTMITQRIRIRE